MTGIVAPLKAGGVSVLTRRFGGMGRVNFPSSGNWIVIGDDNFGINNENFTEDAGGASTPLHEYEVSGEMVSAHERLTALRIRAMATNSEITDVEYALYHRAPNVSTLDGTLNTDAEISNTLIAAGNFSDTITVPMSASALYAWTIDLDYPVPAEGEVTIYLRPVGTLAATRFLRFGWQWSAEPKI